MIGPRHLAERVALTSATLQKFRDKPFRWGTCDCALIVTWHLEQFGHQTDIAKAGSYKTAKSAMAAMKRAGFDSVAAGLDAVGLPRIAPAEAWVGDIVQGESGDPFGALGVMLGNGAMLGFHEDAKGAAVLRRLHLGTAWRVMPV